METVEKVLQKGGHQLSPGTHQNLSSSVELNTNPEEVKEGGKKNGQDQVSLRTPTS